MTAERRALAELESLCGLDDSRARRLEKALAIICTTVNAPLAKVLELDESGSDLIVRVGLGWQDGVVGRATVPATSASTAGYALRQRRAVIFNDIQGTSRFTDATLLRSHNVRSSVAVRIMADGGPVGVLSVHELSLRQFSDRDAAFIEQAADMIAQILTDSTARAGTRPRL